MGLRNCVSFKEDWDTHMDSICRNVPFADLHSYQLLIFVDLQVEIHFLLVSFAAVPCQVRNVEERTDRAYKARDG